MAAGGLDSDRAQAALEQLCRSYWQPIYAFVRRQGYSPTDAQDLTQDFFLRLLAKKHLGDAVPAKGRFRSFLLAAVKHFLANEWDKSRAAKRGGGLVFVPECAAAEGAYGAEGVEHLTADKLFDRRWANALLEQVLGALRAEYTQEGKAEWFESLKGTLTGERLTLHYAELGASLGMSEGAVKVAVHRMRQRFREQLRQEIAQTVTRPEEIEEELSDLFAALGP
jgi:RNA polymerase sigma factor (sigma-70 family)